jgi:hypothetical protein
MGLRPTGLLMYADFHGFQSFIKCRYEMEGKYGEITPYMIWPGISGAIATVCEQHVLNYNNGWQVLILNGMCRLASIGHSLYFLKDGSCYLNN